MKRLILAGALALSAISAQAGFVFLPYQLTSPDDLGAITVGQTVHLEASIVGLSPNVWLETSLINNVIRASDATLWSTPFNLVYSSDLDPAGALTFTSPGEGGLLYAPPFGTPLTSTTDFVLGFDITAIAAGSGSFSVLGADLFSVDGNDLYVTSSDFLGFAIADASHVAEPETLWLLATALLIAAVSRRHRANGPRPPSHGLNACLA